MKSTHQLRGEAFGAAAFRAGLKCIPAHHAEYQAYVMPLLRSQGVAAFAEATAAWLAAWQGLNAAARPIHIVADLAGGIAARVYNRPGGGYILKIEDTDAEAEGTEDAIYSTQYFTGTDSQKQAFAAAESILILS